VFLSVLVLAVVTWGAAVEAQTPDGSPAGADATAGRLDPPIPPPAPPPANNSPPPRVAIDRPGLTAAQEERYQEGLRSYQQRRYPQAIELYTSLARDNTCCGVLGMVVASYASTAPTPERAAAAAADADAHRDDTLKQFIAGVLAHYAAHVNGRDQEEKRRLYEQALRYLDRTRPTYDFEPRVFIYLAVSNFRLGRQQLAEQFIERAVLLAQHDPDAYYCRAEIFQRTNVRRSIEDINLYLRTNAVNEARGAVGDPGKTARVIAMRDHLIAVSEGRANPRELFDPVRQSGREPDAEDTRTPGPPSATPSRGTAPGGRGRAPLPYALGLVGVALVAWLGMRFGPKLLGKDQGPKAP
jgi:tetratricopeptide (TPR) repeat protein